KSRPTSSSRSRKRSRIDALDTASSSRGRPPGMKEVGPGCCVLGSSLGLDDSPLPEQVLDLLHLLADEQHVGQVEVVRLRPGGFDDQVARTQAEDDVAEQVGPLPLQRQAGGVVDLLATTDLGADLELAGLEDYVGLLVEHQDGDQPDNE